MKKWQLILCSLSISFIPALLFALVLTVTSITMNITPNALLYFPLLPGIFFSYLIYTENKELVK